MLFDHDPLLTTPTADLLDAPLPGASMLLPSRGDLPQCSFLRCRRGAGPEGRQAERFAWERQEEQEHGRAVSSTTASKGPLIGILKINEDVGLQKICPGAGVARISTKSRPGGPTSARGTSWPPPLLTLLNNHPRSLEVVLIRKFWIPRKPAHFWGGRVRRE